MEITLIAFFQAVLWLFAIVDPVGGIPVFIALTRGLCSGFRPVQPHVRETPKERVKAR